MRRSSRFATIGRIVQGLRSPFMPRFKVLAYHSINVVSRDPFELTIAAFEQQMRFLATKGYHVISLEQALSNMLAGTIHEKTVVITFDDGFEGLGRFAFPILKNFRFPAMVFLPFDYVGGIDAFSYQDPRPEMRLLNWTMIEESRKDGISYGSHTMSHRNLVDLDAETLRYELVQSKRLLTERLGEDFHALAYPFGMFDERVKLAARESGYHCAVCFGNILSNTRNTDPVEMKREKLLTHFSADDFAYIANVKNDLARKTTHLLRRAVGRAGVSATR